MTKGNRGGPRVPGPAKVLGQPRKPAYELREKVSTTLAPGTWSLAQELVDLLGYKSRGQLIDDLILKAAKEAELI